MGVCFLELAAHDTLRLLGSYTFNHITAITSAGGVIY